MPQAERVGGAKRAIEIGFRGAGCEGAMLIENAFNRLKDFRRIATRYARLARNYLASVCLAGGGTSTG